VAITPGSLLALLRPLLNNDYVYDVAVTGSLDFLRTKRTIKTTRIQLKDFRAKFGNGIVTFSLRPGLNMEFDLSQDLDAFMYEYLLSNGAYEKEVESILSKVVNADSTFIDVGANLGYFTLLFSEKARTVYSFEPIPDVYERLSRNVRLNGLSNVRTLRRAVSRRGGKLRLFESKIYAGHDSAVKRFEHNKSIVVDAVSLDEVVEPPLGDVVVKVDVEGAEMDVILGAMGLIRSGKVRAIVLEWARYLYPRVAELAERFSLYSSLGSVEVLDSARGRRVSDRRDLPEICNLLITVNR
jgi:FkbM family methyltransferase